MSPAGMILLGHALIGAWLGARSPVGGLATLVALVATTSALYWHLGIGNLATVEVFLVCMLLGAGVGAVARQRADGRAAGDGYLTGTLGLWAALAVMTMGVATVLALVADAWSSEPADLSVSGVTISRLLAYPALGSAGRLQAAFVALVGPALLLIGIRSLAGEVHRRQLLRGFLAGLVLAVAAPAVQAVWFNPWARPDIGLQDAGGISGLFRDPHGFAAYLVLGIGVAIGTARGCFRSGAANRARLHMLVAAAAGTALLFTNSRSGLIAAIVATAIGLALAGPLRAGAGARRGLPSARWPAVAALVLAAAAAALLAASPTARGFTHDGLSRFAAMRMWDPLRPDVAIWQLPSTRVRLALWRKSLTIMAQRPLWGVGPAGFRDADIPLMDRAGALPESIATVNAHNYFLQLGAEYGVPALAAFLVLNGIVLALIGRAARRCRDPAQRGLLAGICGGQIGLLAISLTSHPMLLAEIQAVYWTVAALGVAAAIHSPADQSRSSRSRATSKPKYGTGAANGTAPPPEWMPPKPSST